MNAQVIRRIMEMEYRFDLLRQCDPEQVRQDPNRCRMLQDLTDYYEGGTWLADYTLDEEGLLPRWLKRGVLSEDGLYDLLCDLQDTENNP